MKKLPLFSIWLVYLLVIVAGGVYVGIQGFKIDTDFLSIFPSHAERGGFYQASAQYESNFTNEILVFVQNADRDKAIAAAEELSKKISQNEIFSSVKLKFSGNAQDQWVPFLYSKRQALLTPEQTRNIESGQSQIILNKALTNIYSPMGLTTQLGTDPLNLFQDFFLNTAANFSVKPFNGYLISEKDGKYAVFMRVKINRNAYSFNADLIEFYEGQKAEYTAKGTDLHFLGASLFSAFGSEKSMREVNLYGGLSFTAVMLLLVWAFSSAIPVIATLATIGISVGTGLVAVMLVYSSVHVLSIVLGISVLGIVTDYCTHFFAKGFDEKLENNEQVMKKIKGALVLGFLTNTLTYLCFYFTDLIVLKQLAIFTIAGIFTTFLTVIGVFPKFKFRRLHSKGLDKVVVISNIWNRVGHKKAMITIFVIVLVGLVLTRGLKFNDDIKLLQSVPTVLKNDETKVTELLGIKRSASYFIVKGTSVEDVLKKEEALSAKMRENNVKALAISNFSPSLERQKQSLTDYQKLEPIVKEFYKTINYNDQSKIKALFVNAPTPFVPSNLLATSSEFPLAMNWLGKINGEQFSVVTVGGDANLEILKALETEDVHLISKAADLSNFMQVLRETITGQFAYVIAALLLLLVLWWGWKRAFYILYAPVVSAIATMLFIRICYGYLNLFNVLAVILIFCLGMDYSVFFSQSKESTRATHVGILISFISTIEAFGVLSMSSTYAVSSFGVSVFVGICLCYLLSPLAAGAEHD
jgi:Predicted exporter